MSSLRQTKVSDSSRDSSMTVLTLWHDSLGIDEARSKRESQGMAYLRSLRRLSTWLPGLAYMSKSCNAFAMHCAKSDPDKSNVWI